MDGFAAQDKKIVVKMAHIYSQEEKWDKAIEEYKKLLILDPNDLNIQSMLGDMYLKNGSISEAYTIYVKLRNVYNAMGDQDKISNINKKISLLESSELSMDAQNLQSTIRLTQKADQEIENGQWGSAAEILNQILKIEPDNLSALQKLAIVMESKGEKQEAAKQYVALGSEFSKNRLYKKAQEVFQKALELNSEQLQARIELAQIYSKQGMESDAKKEFLNLAETYLKLDDFEKAQQFANKAIEFKSIEAHYVLGVIYYFRQMYAEAKIELEELLRFKINHIGALAHLARIFLQQKQFDKAWEQIQKAQKNEKNNVYVLEALVDYYFHKGMTKETTDAFEEFIQQAFDKKEFKEISRNIKMFNMIELTNPSSYEKIAQAFEQLGKMQETEQYYLKAKQLLGDTSNKIESLAQGKISGTNAESKTNTVQKEIIPPETKKAAIESNSLNKNLETLVVDLEVDSEIKERSASPKAEVTPAPEVVFKESSSKNSEVDAEITIQMGIADNYLKQELIEEAIDMYQQILEKFPHREDVRLKLNSAYTLYVKSGERILDALESEKRKKELEEQRVKAEIEKKAKEEVERKIRADVERKAREEAVKTAENELRQRRELEAMTKRAQEEADRRIKEETEKRARAEFEKKRGEDEQRVKIELEKRVQAELEKKRKEEEQRAKIELEQRVQVELEKKRKEEEQRAKIELEKRVQAELEKKRKEDEQKAKLELEKRVQEETEKRLREELEKKKRSDNMGTSLKELGAKKKTDSNLNVSSKTSSPKSKELAEEPKDEFMTIAVADIYLRQGLYSEAMKICKSIMITEPDNFEAKKKLEEIEMLMKSKGLEPLEKKSVMQAINVSAEKQTVVSPAKADSVKSAEKENYTKKKSGKVGYV
jgi:tetratricopeptide (TPR) repeat protein